jgi:hypothetical protein
MKNQVTIGQLPLTNPSNMSAAIQVSHTEAMEFV